jgi:hypothetical protein
MKKTRKTFKKISQVAIYGSFLFLSLTSLFCIIITPAVSGAQTSPSPSPQMYIPLAPLPYTTGKGGVSSDCNSTPNQNGIVADCPTDFLTYLTGGFKLAIAAASILAVIMITYGGFEYMLSAVPGRKANGKETITNALQGLILALGSYLILSFINPDLTILKFNPTPDATITAPTDSTLYLTPSSVDYKVQGQIAKELRDELTQAKQNLDAAQANGTPDQVQAAQAEYTRLSNTAAMNSALNDIDQKEGYTRIQSILSGDGDAQTNRNKAIKLEQQMLDTGRNNVNDLRSRGDDAEADVLQEKILSEKARIDNLLDVSIQGSTNSNVIAQTLESDIKTAQDKVNQDSLNGASATQIANDQKNLLQLQNKQITEDGLKSVDITNSPERVAEQVKNALNQVVAKYGEQVELQRNLDVEDPIITQARKMESQMVNDVMSKAAQLQANGDQKDADLLFQRAQDAQKRSSASIDSFKNCLTASYTQGIRIKDACQ